MPAPEAVVFDAYGTLLDVNAARWRAMPRGSATRWEALSSEWRAKQLEYSWVRSLTGPAHHENFWLCTRDALAFVFARHGIADAGAGAGPDGGLPRACPPIRRCPAVLRALRERGIAVAILSNGTPGMLADAVSAAAD